MQIKEPARAPLGAPFAARIRRALSSRGRRTPLLALAGAVLLAGAFAAGGRFGPDVYQAARSAYLTRPSHLADALRGRLAQPPRLAIDISHTNLQQLRFKREQAFERGIIVTADDSYVNANISADGRSVRARLRLKGDYPDHLEGRKWSFRIKVKGDEALWGMRRFSIQDPKRSGFIKEWILHRLLRHEGLIGLRYDFVEVSLNGENLGVFALEESFSKELVESNQRIEAPILKFDETHQIDHESVNLGDRRSLTDVYYAADVLSFDTKKVLATEKLREQYLVGRSLLTALRDGSAPLADVLDVERAARTFAVLELVKGFHAIHWKNARFYYDPVRTRLELIAYNAHSPRLGLGEIDGLFYEAWRDGDPGPWFVQDWLDRFFADAGFRELYFRELERLTAPDYLEAFFASADAALGEERAALFRDGPLRIATAADYLRNRDALREILHPQLALKATFEGLDPEHGLRLTLHNRAFLPVELRELRCDDAARTLPRRVLAGKSAGQPLRSVTLTFEDRDGTLAPCLGTTERLGETQILRGLSLHYAQAGGGPTRSVRVEAGSGGIPIGRIPVRRDDTTSLEELARRGVVALDDATIRFLPGHWRIDDDVVIPAGRRVRGDAGTTLSLERGAALVSLSPVALIGEPDAPFTLGSDDGTGQGLTVLSAGGPSVLRHVVVRDQGSPERPGWRLTGAVTFYESPVAIENTRFEGGRSEDQLNLIRSDYTVQGARFARSASDALDVDFGDGRVTGTSFHACGNDCVDVSQSETEIRDVAIDGAGDKGISIGERSRVAIGDAAVAGAEIGVACKDGSRATIDGLRVEASTVGIAAYRKKPEFDGGAVDARRVELAGAATPYQRDAFSEISVEDVPQ